MNGTHPSCPYVADRIRTVSCTMTDPLTLSHSRHSYPPMRELTESQRRLTLSPYAPGFGEMQA